MSKEQVRVLRIIEYVGSREWVENTLRNGSVPMIGQKDFGNGIIKSTVIDTFPEVIEESKKDKDNTTENNDKTVYNEKYTEKVFELIEDRLCVDSRLLSIQDNLFNDLGANELDIMELVMDLEDIFDIEISDEEVEKIKYIRDIIKLIQDKK